MSSKTVNWGTGTGAITLDYTGHGDGTIAISSDPNNLYESRSMQIIVKTTDGSNIERTISIQQAAKTKIDLSNAVVSATNQTYNGTAQTPTPTVTLNGNTVPSTGYDVSYSNNTNAGTATITITGKGDYTGTAYGTFTINKATPSYTAPSTRSLTYSGSSQYLTTSGSTSHGTIYYSTDSSNWYTSRRTGTNAGTYYCYWKLVGDSNHTDISSTYLGTTSIAKASRTISWSSYPSSLNIGGSGTLSATVSAGSGDGTISYSSNKSSTAAVSGSTVTGIANGTATITASVSAGTNYKSASVTYTISITNIVDLGLPSGRLWAHGNIKKSGSTYSIGSPSEYGCYFSWGNIDGHNKSDGYVWGTTNSDVYNGTPGHSKQSNISPTDATYDAAYARLGGSWHLPTTNDIAELYDNTTKTKTTYNGVSGWKFAKQSDPRIFVFIPFGGNGYRDTVQEQGNRFGCWASNHLNDARGYNFYANTSQVYRSDNTEKYRGYNIRPVI